MIEVGNNRSLILVSYIVPCGVVLARKYPENIPEFFFRSVKSIVGLTDDAVEGILKGADDAVEAAWKAVDDKLGKEFVSKTTGRISLTGSPVICP